MSVGIVGTTAGGSVQQEVNPDKGARVSLMPGFIGSAGGRYRLSARTGLITTIAAKTSSAGHIGAFRWGSSTKTCLVDKIRIAGAIVTDFTTLQEFTLGLFMARAYTASTTGGTQLTLTTDNGKLRTSYPTTALTDMSISTTGALTAGTHTLDAQPFLQATAGEPAASTTSVKVPFENRWEAGANGGPIVLAQNEGLVLANMVLMGAAGTAIATLEVEWREILNADLPTF